MTKQMMFFMNSNHLKVGL